MDATLPQPHFHSSPGALMHQYPADIYKEPEPDTDTLANLGPLSSMAGVWSGTTGEDVNPKADGP